MPIRFRCAYCNQLMGIARRKAGTVVRCPNCAGQVVVPSADEAPEEPQAPAPAENEPQPPAPAEPRAAAKPQLFERSDFEEVFKGQKPSAPPPRSGPSPPSPSAPPVPVPFQPKQTARASIPERLEIPSGYTVPPPPPPGIVISPSMATLLSVAAVVALALAFIAGLMVGRFYLQSKVQEPEEKSGTRAVPGDPIAWMDAPNFEFMSKAALND